MYHYNKIKAFWLSYIATKLQENKLLMDIWQEI